mmetsp:Transcript_49622/g.118144  ORF Transcript_49622/g.118144 Transcript_49622/m.118144 type:complete len:587 (-) Transcript_49622:58-1818(-)
MEVDHEGAEAVAASVPLRDGLKVELRGLVAAVELNGTVGRLHGFHKEKGRWMVRLPGESLPKLLKAENLVPITTEADYQNYLVEVLSEDAVVLMCSFLPGQTLLELSACSRPFHSRARNSEALWSHLCRALLGETLVKLHEEVWDFPACPDKAEFWRELFQSAYRGEAFHYANDFREKITGSGLPCIRQAVAEHEQAGRKGAVEVSAGDVEADLDKLLSASGHTACALGKVVAILGGWRPDYIEEDIFVTLLDVHSKQMFKPTLAEGSARPERRLRHSSCVVQMTKPIDPTTRGAWNYTDEAPSTTPVALVLGGCNDRTHAPCPGLHTLFLMEVVKDDCSEIFWHEQTATGQAPTALWHHVCGSFAKGKKVVVFGGDMNDDDPEFADIADRLYASHVYILDLDAKHWEKVSTKGRMPGWRSMGVGVSYSALGDNSERFVIMGGTLDHCPIFAGGEPADMDGYALNLSTMRWQKGRVNPKAQPGSTFQPSARMRFAAERYGRHLLVVGGHGRSEIDDEEFILQLNLMTLEWKTVRVSGQAMSHPRAPACALAGGVLAGGVQFRRRGGVVPIPKLDVLCLLPPGIDVD